ncbi:hypothetical protein AB1M95_10785 [Sulfitobacter sp. LCG007]
MKKSLFLLVTVLASISAAWFIFVQVCKPSDQDYLETATSNYFKHMSEFGLNELASYEDCRLDQGDPEDRRQGVSMFGLCRTESDTRDFHYMIAMSPTASFVYSDLEEIAK